MTIELDLPRPQAWPWLWGLTLLLPLILLAVMLGPTGSPSKSWLVAAAAGLPALGLAVALNMAARRQRAWVQDGTLHVVSTFYHRRIPLAKLDLDDARVVNLRERREWRPWLRSNGFALPGMVSGWYRLRGWRKAFAAYGDPERVLRIDAGDFVLLLGAAYPQTALEALRRSCGGSA